MAKQQADQPGSREFIILMAAIISLVALSTDAMLPALSDIGTELGTTSANQNQWVLTALFIGFAAGQIVYGPVSDSVGRRPMIFLGLILFCIGCVISLFATNFTAMLVGRVLQGFGAAGPRIVTIALIRDLYRGPAMARIMSFIMAVFIFVPAIAPSLGQGLLLLAHWRAIFVSFLLLAIVNLVWFALRQPETLSETHRSVFSTAQLISNARAVFRYRSTIAYTLASGFIFGAFMGFLISVQQIFQWQYALGNQFPLYFAVLALSLGSASLLNARLVMRYGMRYLCFRALYLLCALGLGFVVYSYIESGHPPLWTLMGYLMLSFFCVGILFGNLNTLAMEPLGHIAGSGAAVVGFFNNLISLVLGTTIGQSYDGTALPLVTGFAVLGSAALVTLWWTEKPS